MTITKKIANWLSGSAKAIDMTTGRILPTLISFAMPIMAGNLFQLLYSMVDTAVVGRGVGAQALAAVGVTSPVTQLLLGLVTGMTCGVSVVIAQHFGSGSKEKTRQAIASGIVLITIISAFVTLAGILLCRPLFRLISTPEELMDGAALYSVVTFAGTAAAAAYNYEAGVLRAFGNSVIPLLFLVLTSLLNVGLDLLFVLAFGWGIAGVAAYTAGSKMDSIVYQVLSAFGTAASTFAAQNYGKGDLGRVRQGVRQSLGITVGISLALTALVFLSGRHFLALFIDPSETEILASAMQYIRTTSLFYVILGVNYIVRFTLTGVGKSVIPMAVGISEILTRAAVTYLLVYRVGFLGMAFASPACWFTSTLLCVACYKPMMGSAKRALEKRLQSIAK